MFRRHKVGRRHSRKLFSRTARRTHVRNFHARSMRGGIRF